MRTQTVLAIISSIAAIISALSAIGSVAYFSGKIVKEVEALRETINDDIKPELTRLNLRIDDLYSLILRRN